MPIYICPRCNGDVLPDLDEHFRNTLLCIQCGWKPTPRDTLPKIHGDGEHRGKRGKGPQIGKVKL